MIEFSPLIFVGTTLIPIIVGWLWYNPKSIGRFLELNNPYDSLNLKYIIVLLFFAFLYSVALHFQVIHQLHFQSLFDNEIGFKNQEGVAYNNYNFIMDAYGNKFRTFGHGAFHGFLNSIFIVLPILFISFIGEKKTWKFYLVHWGFWSVCNIVMGGIICQYL